MAFNQPRPQLFSNDLLSSQIEKEAFSQEMNKVQLESRMSQPHIPIRP